MIVTWSYKERDTIIQRLDPRARLIFILCAIIAIIQVWDFRILVIWLGITMLGLFLARLTWRETRRFWLVVLPIITMLVVITALTGRGGEEAYRVTHPLWTQPVTLPLLGTRRLAISVEQLVFAASQFVRMVSMATLGLLIPFTIHPAYYGITFRGLGMSDKFAVATDLAFRLVPTVAFQVTFDAQKARGYELERKGAGLIQQIRNLAPLIVPVTIGTLLKGEDIIDAMDLRAFGATARRTWIVELHYARRDHVLIALGVLALAVTTVGNVLGYGDFWVPEVLLRMTGG